MQVYLLILKGMIHRSFLLLGGIIIFLSSVGAVNAQTKTNTPKDTSFHETIKPVNDLNGDGISDYIYTHINGKGIPESTIIEGKTNVNTFFGWRIGQMESFIIILSAFLGLLWFPYNRLYNKIVDVRTEMKEEVKATEERLNKRMDKAEVEIKEIKDTLNNISQTLVKIETRLNTEERIIQIINNQNNQLNNK